MGKLASRVSRWLAVGVLWCPVGWTDVCQVPSGSHPTIQSAIDDAGCTEIVLAAQVFEESVLIPRNLALRGASQDDTVIAVR